MKLAKEDMPQYKMSNSGHNALTDSELLSVVVGSLPLAQAMMSENRHDLRNIKAMSLRELCKYSGIGESKAAQIKAAFELGRRANIPREPVQVTCSGDAYGALSSELSDLDHEEFWILALNRANYIIDKIKISQGGLAGTVVDTRLVFKKALNKGACSVILAHNHPSGNLEPSRSDKDLTSRLKEAGKILDIDVLDHIIVGKGTGYYSFADEWVL